MRGLSGLLLACLVAAGSSAEEEQEATDSWQMWQWNMSLTVSPFSTQEDDHFVVVKCPWGNDLRVHPCSDPPCLPSNLKYSQSANISVDTTQGKDRFHVWIAQVPEEYRESMGFKLKVELDGNTMQRFVRGEVNGQDVLGDLTEKGEITIEPDEEEGHSIDIEAIALKGSEFSQCAWDKESCFKGKCCKSDGMVCYLKDEFWGMCRPWNSCAPGIDPGDGQDWSCNIVGGKPETEPLPSAPSDSAAGTSMFCFTVSSPLSYEEELIAAQKKKKAGIFGCEKSTVVDAAFIDQESQAIVIKDWTAVWDEVKDGGFWKETDWTVKVQPDCVFVAQLARSKLEDLRPFSGAPMYLKNVKDGIGLPATFMMVSSYAMELLFDDPEDCRSNVERRKGENFYIATCLDVSGARYMLDEDLINDQGASEKHEWDSADTKTCADGKSAVYRPFQQADHWLDCFTKASGASASVAKELRL